MPTRTQTPSRPAGSRFGRPVGKPAQRPARGRSTPSPRRPAMPSMGRKPAKSGAAKTADKLAGLLPGTLGQKRATRGQKRGASGHSAKSGPGKKGTAGLALLAGAAGLLVKNREKLASMIRHRDSSGDAVKPVEPQADPFASNSGPVDPAAVPNPPASPPHPAT